MQITPVKSKVAPLATSSLWLLGWLFLLLPTFALTALVEAAALPTVSRVKDIDTAPGSSDPQDIVKVGNITFFTAVTPTTGRELWKSDGTAAGTVLVKDIYVGSGNSYPSYLTPVNNVLYFSASSLSAQHVTITQQRKHKNNYNAKIYLN